MLTDKKKLIIFRVLPYLAGLVLLAVYLYGCFGIQKDKNGVRIEAKYADSFSENWINEADGSLISTSEIKIASHVPSVISSVIPEIEQNTQMCFWLFNIRAEIFIDEKPAGEFGYAEFPSFGKEQGGLWRFVEIPKDCSGKKIKFIISSDWGNTSFNLDKILLGNKESIALAIYRQNAMAIFFSMGITILAFFLLLYTFVLNHYKITEYGRLLISFFFLSIDSVLYIFCESSLLQFVISNPTVRFMLSFISVFLLPVIGLIFFREFFTYGKKAFYWMQLVYSSLLIVLFILYALDIVSVFHSVSLVYVAVFSITFEVFLAGIKDYRRSHDNLNLWMIAALSVLIIGTIFSVSMYYLGFTTDNIKPFYITYLLFITMLFCTLMRKTFRTFSTVSSADYYKEIALQDKVTGGKSPLFFKESLSSIQVENAWFLLIDFSHFKLVNQIIGRRKSDLLLRNLYSIADGNLKYPEFMCNLGSAKFGALIYAEDDLGIYNRTFKLYKDIDRFADVKGTSLKVDVKFGACRIMSKQETLEDLVDQTSIAVNSKYAVHFQDVDCYIFNEECRKHLIDGKILEDHIEDAIANNEFQVYLQPKIKLSTRDVYAAEALIRWIHPERGFIAPDQFIPLFEQDGKIEQVDIFVFTSVCKLIKKWIAKGIEPPVISVNISKAAINTEGYFQTYMDIVKKYEVPGKYLEFELTESIAYEDLEILREIINQIHSIGSTCSMDDFGKSYSNINALSALPFDTVKMDKCFFDQGFPSAVKASQLIKGAVSLLKSLDLHIVAEGIEEEEQVKALSRLKVDAIQGYYFAKPMNITDFENYYQTHKNK